jgi:hypothetical protein
LGREGSILSLRPNEGKIERKRKSERRKKGKKSVRNLTTFDISQ